MHPLAWAALWTVTVTHGQMWSTHEQAAPATQPATPRPTVPKLFSKPEELFQLKDGQGNAPEVTIFDKTFFQRRTAQALQQAAITLESDPERVKLVRVEPRIRMRFEGIVMKLDPNDASKVRITLIGGSGEYDIEVPISRRALEAGEPVEISLPQKQQSLAGFQVLGSGKLKFRWNASSGQLVVEEASGSLSVTAPVAGTGSDSGSTKGTGVRVDSIVRKPKIKIN